VLHIRKIEHRGMHRLWLAFDNGVAKTIDVSPLLEGPIFERLRDVGYFAEAQLDPVCGTVVWPNDADIAPEALYELPALEGAAA
jgi:hypothetical protein